MSDWRNLDSTPLVLGIGAACLVAAAAMWLNASMVLAGCVSLILTLAVALGALRNGTLGPFRYWLAAALVAWLAAFGLMHWLPATTDTLILGLPPATAVSLFLLWPGPLLLVTLPYALHFEGHILSTDFRQGLHLDNDDEQDCR